MTHSYEELRGLIRWKCGTLTDFAQALGISNTSLNARLQGRIPFKQTEIARAKEQLQLSSKDIERIFFSS